MALICLAKLMNLGRYRIWEFLLSGTAYYIRAPSTTWLPGQSRFSYSVPGYRKRLSACLQARSFPARCGEAASAGMRARVFREVRLENGKFKTTFTCVY